MPLVATRDTAIYDVVVRRGEAVPERVLNRLREDFGGRREATMVRQRRLVPADEYAQIAERVARTSAGPKEIPVEASAPERERVVVVAPKRPRGRPRKHPKEG